MAHFSTKQLSKFGFKSIGKNVMISDKASFYGTKNIEIGSNVRIDDFVVLSAGTGGISIGNHIHIAVFTSIIGAGKVTLHDFSNISSRVSIFSSSDDYSGTTMTNPMIPDKFKNVKHADVVIGKHSIIASGTVVLPGVTLHEGVAVGALSLVNKDCKAYGIYAGIPVKFIKERERNILELEKKFTSEFEGKQ